MKISTIKQHIEKHRYRYSAIAVIGVMAAAAIVVDRYGPMQVQLEVK